MTGAESRAPDAGKLHFIKVKGRMAGADSITVTRNEVLTALNQARHFTLAISGSGRTGNTKCAMCGSPSAGSLTSGR